MALAAPATVNDALTFDSNPPPASSSASTKGSKGGRMGTMRIKGGMKNFSAMEEEMAQQEEAEKQRAQSIFSGYLKHLKESGMKATWSKRYVVLTKDSLSCHRSADAFKAMKTFELNGDCYVREISQRPGVTDCQNAMELFLSRSKSTVFKGASQRETTEWITAICSVIDTFAASEDDEMEFIDEDEFDFIDEEEEVAAAPSLKEVPVVKPASPVIDFSAEVEQSSGLDDAEEESDESSFEWVDEDEVHKPKESAPSTEKKKKTDEPPADTKPATKPVGNRRPVGAKNPTGQQVPSPGQRGRPLQARQVAGQLRGRPGTPYAGRAPRGRGNPIRARPSGLPTAGRGGAAPASGKSASPASVPAKAPAKSANRVGNLMTMFEAPK